MILTLQKLPELTNLFNYLIVLHRHDPSPPEHSEGGGEGPSPGTRGVPVGHAHAGKAEPFRDDLKLFLNFGALDFPT